jgi:hypothetical protein
VTDETVDDTTVDRAPAATTTPEASPHYGIGPFSIREVALGVVWLIAFVLSFFPVNLLEGPEGGILGGANVWVSGLAWILAIGLPTAAVFLLALRRLSPQGIRGVGSLGIDQFASVAFSVAALTWGVWLWDTIAFAIEFGFWVRSWVVWVEVVLMLAGVVLTVFAPLLPTFRDDFQERPETSAHRNARPARPVSARPPRPRPEPKAPVADHDSGADDAAAHGGGAYAAGAHVAATQHAAGTPVTPEGTYVTGEYDTRTAAAPTAAVAYDEEFSRVDTHADEVTTNDQNATDVFAPLTADEPATATEEWSPTDETVVSAQPAQQAFWALVPEERDVVDEYGAPLFRIGPTAWALVIEDRGAAFVVRHEDGRIGFLHDVSGVTRG